MMFQPDAKTTNIATVVASRNHSLSVSKGRPACWAASREVNGASTTNASASATTLTVIRRRQLGWRRPGALTPAGRADRVVG